MSWLQVDFSCVRYSPVEGTHYFYDPSLPTSIQFLLSGRWESWDVGWVKHKAQDPDIRRIAEEAESQLLQDPRSDYVPWPAAPPSGPPGLPMFAPAGFASPQTGSSNIAPNLPTFSSAQGVADAAQQSSLGSPDSGSSPSSATLGSVHKFALGREPLTNGGSLQNLMVTLPPQHNGSPSVMTTPSTIGPLPNTKPTVRAQHMPNSPPRPAAPAQVILSRTRETKILLSIDGDGIRGLSSLLVIESLVNAVCVRLGQRLDSHQIFDLTGGSSLGGVIAILLCRLRMQAHQAREAYKRIARHVYTNKKYFFSCLHSHDQVPDIDGTALENEIKAIVRDEIGKEDELLLDDREDSGDVFVISTHMEIGTNKAALVRSYPTRRITGPELDANMPIWKAMKATSVAPRYMPPQPGVSQGLMIEPGLVDHGTAKNNPIRDILYECRKLFRYTNDMMIVVSVGTGVGLNRENEMTEMVNSIEDRNSEARAWGDKFEQGHAALMQRNWMKYFRFNVTGLEDVPLEEWCHEDEVKEKTSAYLAQPEVGQKFYACVDAICALLTGLPGR